MISVALQCRQAESASITMRAFQSSNSCDLPRWHSDGYYYQPMTGKQYKIAGTLQGLGTLFFNVCDNMRVVFKNSQKQMFPNETKEEIQKLSS